MVSRSDATADALAPASAKTVVSVLRSSPHAPTRRWYLAAAVTFGLLLTAMMASSNLLGFAVDVIVRRDTGTFVLLLAVVVLSLLVEAACREYARYLFLSRSRMLSVDLRTMSIDAVLRAPVPEMQKLGTGNVITRLTSDIDHVVRTVRVTGVRLVVTILVFPFTLGSLLLIHWGYIIVFVVMAVMIIPMVVMVVRVLPDLANAASAADARRNNALLDTVRGLPTIRAFGLANWADRRLENRSWEAVQATGRRIPVLQRVFLQGHIAYGLVLLITLLISSWLVSNGQLGVGAAAAAMVLIVRLEIPIFSVMSFAGDIQQAVTALGRAVALTQLGTEQTEKPDPQDLLEPPTVELRGVSFFYPDGGAILDGFNLTLAAGTTTALVGTSGAGKSTVASLIAGLLVPTDGTIQIGGVEQSKVADSWTARQIALLNQEVHIFSGTLREDLLLAAGMGTEDAVLTDALARVGLIQGGVWSRELADGLETRVGAGASELSPIVGQQVSLARVILRKPPVLILDEATAEAGSEDAQALEQAALDATAGRTSLVVAHRLDQAVAADRIIVMDEGRIIEDGTHTQLLAAEGHYSRLYASWSDK